MSLQVLLSRLDAVISTGKGTWRARCPGHGSKGRTLAVKEADDGRVLVKCFADCDIHTVLGAVGLSVNDLFPEPLPTTGKREYFPVADVLRCLTQESAVVLVAARDVASGKVLAPEDHKRLTQATQRIHTALEVAR